jgi:RecJ-like exonuclease
VVILLYKEGDVTLMPAKDPVDYEIIVDDSPIEKNDNIIEYEVCSECDGDGQIEIGYSTYICKACQGKGYI